MTCTCTSTMAESEWVVWLAERVIDEVVLTIQVEEHPQQEVHY